LRFEQDYMDLDTGTVQECDFGLGCNGGEDFHVAYNAGRVPHSVIFQEFPAEIAHVQDVAFADVTACDDDFAAYGQGLVDEGFDEDRVIFIRTEAGATFVLGNPIEDDFALTLEWAIVP
jgi:hypothetical protein